MKKCELLTELAHEIEANRNGRTTVVAISGFAGSGKSTLTSNLAKQLDDAEVVSSDEFSIHQQRGRCDNWASIDRARLVAEVLEPARSNQPIRYQQYDWANDRLGDWHDVPDSAFLLIEGLGVIHPDLLSLFDLTVWIECPLEVATERGRCRDREIYKVDHDAVWRDVWTPNDRDYYNRFRPDLLVDVSYVPETQRVSE